MWSLGELSLPWSPASRLPRHRRQALTFPSRATDLGLLSLACVPGAILSLTLISQSLTFLSSFLSCLSAVLALFLSSLLPETYNQPLSDNLDNYSLHTRYVCEAPGLWPAQGLVLKPLAVRLCQRLSSPASVPKGPVTQEPLYVYSRIPSSPGCRHPTPSSSVSVSSCPAWLF